MNRLRSFWLRINEPNDNPWLGLLAASLGLLGALTLLRCCSPFFNEVLR